jgi:hypothetical protein
MGFWKDLKMYYKKKESLLSSLSCRKRMLFLVMASLSVALGFGSILNVRAADQTPASSFNMSLQFQVYSIDLKTEVLYSKYYSFLMWTNDPDVHSFEAVMLRPEYNEAIRFLSYNESGHQQIYEEIETDPEKVSVPWQWKLNPKRSFILGTSFDSYELSFLITINMSTRLGLNDTWFIMPVYMRGDWVWNEQPTIKKLSDVPSNKTLISLGLSPEKFFQYHCNNMTDFYLITESFSFPPMQSWRITIAYLLPSIAILVVLIIATIRFRKMKRSDFLSLYLGAGLFTISFLVLSYQYAPYKLWSWQEILFLLDFAFATGLVICALWKKGEEFSGGSDKQHPSKPKADDRQKAPKEYDDKSAKEMEKNIEKLDRIFDMLIILASIISASLFQFVSSSPYPQDQIANYERILRVSFKLFLIPLVLTIILWVPTQLAHHQTIRILSMKIHAWAYLLQALSVYFLWIVVFGFGHVLNFGELAILAIIICIVIGGLLLRFIAEEYQRALNLEVFKTKDWRFRQLIIILVAGVLMEISIYLSLL